MRALSRSLARSLAPVALFGLLFLSACASEGGDAETNQNVRRPSTLAERL